ncbi:hypothetical protein SYNGFB01_09040 [Synechococcus sp. GFB01]|nr:hypothetical protein SYNGFB01_09040 [Synechococcus sp. GFB01]
MIGLILPPVVFPFILLVMFCAIFSGLVQRLTQFAMGCRCPAMPLAWPPTRTNSQRVFLAS